MKPRKQPDQEHRTQPVAIHSEKKTARSGSRAKGTATKQEASRKKGNSQALDLAGITTSIPVATGRAAKCRILVIGVGGQGGNAAKYVMAKNLAQVTCIAINTDVQDLEKVPNMIAQVIGRTTTRSQGAGCRPDLGRSAFLEQREEIRNMLLEYRNDPDSDQFTTIAFILAGMGGGTGTGAAPELALLLRELLIPAIAVVTVPSVLDGPRKVENTEQGLLNLYNAATAIMLVSNGNVVREYSDEPEEVAFEKVDTFIAEAIDCFVQIIVTTPRRNVDLHDVLYNAFGFDFGTFQNFDPEDPNRQYPKAQMVVIGIGRIDVREEPEVPMTEKVKQAIDKAVFSRLLPRNDIEGAKYATPYCLRPKGMDLPTICDRVAKRHLNSLTKEAVHFIEGGGPLEGMEEGFMQMIVIISQFPEELTPMSVFRDLCEREREEEEEEQRRIAKATGSRSARGWDGRSSTGFSSKPDISLPQQVFATERRPAGKNRAAAKSTAPVQDSTQPTLFNQDCMVGNANHVQHHDKTASQHAELGESAADRQYAAEVEIEAERFSLDRFRDLTLR